MPQATLSPCPRDPVATSMKFNLMKKEVHIQCTQGMDVPWGRVSLQVGVNFAKVHQLRGREKTSLILLG